MNVGSGKKKWIAAAVAVLVIAAAAAVAIYKNTGVYVGSGLLGKTRFSVFETEIDASGMGLDDVSPFCRCRKLEKLDLRGNNVSPEEYEQLCGAIEGCEILWDIPFQGIKLDCRTESITLSELSENDIGTLRLFRDLKEIDATGCEFSQLLVKAKEELGSDVEWKVTALGRVLDKNVSELDLRDMQIGGREEVEQALAFCPSVSSVELTGCSLTDEDKAALRKAYPDAGIHWDFTFFKKTVSTQEDLIDISGKEITDLTAFRALLNNFERVGKLVMCDCKVSNADMEKLCSEYPDIRFVWKVHLGQWSLRTDATHFCTNIITGNEYKLKSEDIEVLKYCTDLEHLDIGHSWVTDISALAGLTKLKTLIIISGGEGVRDISPLAGMVHMQYLELFLNHITDISPLANMHELLDLNLTFNQISDITPLLGLTQLERCWIARNEISEEDMKKLEEALPMCEFNFTVWASTDGGWRLHERYFEMREYFGYMPEIGRAAANLPRPYEVLPENYMTHINKYYKEQQKNER